MHEVETPEKHRADIRALQKGLQVKMDLVKISFFFPPVSGAVISSSWYVRDICRNPCEAGLELPWDFQRGRVACKC